MSDLWRRFSQDESGQGLVEYVLIIAVVALGLVVIMTFLRDEIVGVFGRAGNVLNQAGPTNAVGS